MFDVGSIVAKVAADISGFSAGMKDVIKSGQEAGEQLKSSMTGISQSINNVKPSLLKISAGLGALAAGGIVVMKDWISSASGAQVEMARFNATMDAIPETTEEVKDSLLKAAAAATKLAFDDEEAANVLANFYQRTKDVTEAQKLSDVAMDLSRQKNIDLSSAANLVTQVLSGNGRVLRQYGIDIKESATPLEALAQLQGVVGGQADAYMETFKGKSEALGVAIVGLKEQLGDILIPVLEKFTSILSSVIEYLANLSPETKQLIAYVVLATTAFAAIAAPVLLLITMIPVLTGVISMITTGIGLILSPIGLVIIAMGLLFLAWKTNLFGIRDLVSNVWQFIKDAFTIGGKFIQDSWHAVLNAISTVSEVVFSKIKEIFKGVINYFIDQINSLISLVNSVAKKLTFGKSSGVISEIPRLAEGGIVTRPTLAMIGEGGESEAVIPLSRLGSVGGGVSIVIQDSLIADEESAKNVLEKAFKSMNLAF